MQTHQRTWWTVENFAFLRRNDFLDEKNSTPRNWEHLCHQRKNAVNNWTIIDRQPFEYEAVCNVAVEGKLQNASVAWLSNACAFPFVPIMACCVLTLQESAGSTAGSLGLSASIILHIKHIMKKEQAKRSLSIYFLQHPSLSTPLTSPWQTAQPAAIPRQLTCSKEQIFSLSADKLLWPLASSNDIILVSSRQIPHRHSWRGDTLSHLAACNLADSRPLCRSDPQKTLHCTSWWHLLAGWTTLKHRHKGPRDPGNTRGHGSSLTAASKIICPQEEKTELGMYCFQDPIPLHQLRTAPQHNLSCNTNCAAMCCATTVRGQMFQDIFQDKKGKMKVINLVVISWLVAQIFTCYFAQSV